MNEGEGTYMNSINKQVNMHANAILQATKRKRKQMKQNPDSVLTDAVECTQKEAEKIYLDPQIFRSPEPSKEELDNENEIEIEIIADTDKEEEKEKSSEIIGQPGWMKEIAEKVEEIRQKKNGQEEDSDSAELLSETHSEIEVDSEWRPESDVQNDTGNVSDGQEEEIDSENNETENEDDENGKKKRVTPSIQNVAGRGRRRR